MSASIDSDKMARAAANRAKMPKAAAAIDELRAVFGDIKVLYVREGDYELGRRPDRSGLVVPNVGEGIPPKKSKR